MWEIFAGMTLVITKGYPIRPLGPAFTMYGQGAFFGIPGPVLLFLSLCHRSGVGFDKTRFGRNLYAIGGNRDAAVLVGIPVVRVELLVYALAGMFAALAGIMYASRMDAGQPVCGRGLADESDYRSDLRWHLVKRRPRNVFSAPCLVLS